MTADDSCDEVGGHAGRPRQAGAAVRYQAIIHDFATLEALPCTWAANPALAQATDYHHDALSSPA